MNLDTWLKETAYDKLYWAAIYAVAKANHYDGCTGVPDWLVWTCLEHDLHYATAKMLDGTPIDKATADYIFRVRIQQGSGFGVFSPASWWRWLGVRWFGTKAWNGHRRKGEQ